MIKTAVENRQNLIVEGCYVPFDWRQDLDDRYLSSIRFVCLAMTEGYIERHFDEILGYESVIEARFVDTGCTVDSLKADNKRFREGFQRAGELVTLIDDTFEQTINREVEK